MQVEWAMHVGLHQHPEWYPTLTEDSSFEEFQHRLYTGAQSGSEDNDCPEPCCHDSLPGERCYWDMGGPCATASATTSSTTSTRRPCRTRRISRSFRPTCTCASRGVARGLVRRPGRRRIFRPSAFWSAPARRRTGRTDRAPIAARERVEENGTASARRGPTGLGGEQAHLARCCPAPQVVAGKFAVHRKGARRSSRTWCAVA
mmetsp:Transcript_110183/g.215999  ORF Transcript_110183/g.215999 Transcript_110183/m.215999 type:complete len:203 (+) Transcript_110183:458-1066(+)